MLYAIYDMRYAIMDCYKGITPCGGNYKLQTSMDISWWFIMEMIMMGGCEAPQGII
jgi:hypothetical protein